MYPWLSPHLYLSSEFKSELRNKADIAFGKLGRSGIIESTTRRSVLHVRNIMTVYKRNVVSPPIDVNFICISEVHILEYHMMSSGINLHAIYIDNTILENKVLKFGRIFPFTCRSTT